MKHVIVAAAVFICADAACVASIAARIEMRATEEVCDLVRANYFRQDQADVRDFLKQCQIDEAPFTFSRTRAIEHINHKLSQIQSSHLSLYSPDENRLLWENEGSDTGLRARVIDGEVVIFSTLETSPARKARLQPGDVVVAINGEKPTSAQDAQTTAGKYKIARGRTFFLTELKLEDLKEDLSPKLLDAGGGAAVLSIPSFLPVYFEKKQWTAVARQLARYNRVVIDLRGNPGGSFPAMLRALSPFRCRESEIGRIWREPRSESLAPTVLQDELSADEQLKQITSSDKVILQTFADTYGRFSGAVTVLIDSNTSSVSEIFAEALVKRAHSRVWGGLSAGQVVMARWFSISALGGGDYAMSIPIAGYRAQNGFDIEGSGVLPELELHYDLEAALRGEDSWLNKALHSP